VYICPGRPKRSEMQCRAMDVSVTDRSDDEKGTSISAHRLSIISSYINDAEADEDRRRVEVKTASLTSGAT